MYIWMKLVLQAKILLRIKSRSYKMFFPQENMIIVTFLRELWERTSKSNFFFFFLSIHHLNLETDELTQRRLYSRALSKESDLFLQKISSSLNLCLSLSHIHTHTYTQTSL